MLLLLLLVALLLGSGSAAPLSGNATREVLLSNELRYLSAAGVELEGGALLSSTQLSTPEVCAQKCIEAGPKCAWFTATCDAAQASVAGGTGRAVGRSRRHCRCHARQLRLIRTPGPPLQACRCELFTANCTLAPSVSAGPPAAGGTITSGEAAMRPGSPVLLSPPEPSIAARMSLHCRLQRCPRQWFACLHPNRPLCCVCRRAAALRPARCGHLCRGGRPGGAGC